MSKKKITEIIEEITADFLKENGLELYNSEFVKEGKDWFLRVYIDKLQDNKANDLSEEAQGNADGNIEPKEEYVSTDDCELVSRFLSAELDRLDPIEQNYYLEVSSPGMDRVLFREKDYKRFAGHIVDISLYKAVDGKKSYQGVLVGIADDKIIIKDEKDNEIEFPCEQVAKTRLAVIF